MSVGRFASRLLRALVAHDERARALVAQTRGKTSIVGIMDGADWVPLLRLHNPSASFNVMNLGVRQGSGWAVPYLRGTPDQIAAQLTGPLAFTWQTEIDALDPPAKRTSDHEH
jgi:hypothetical protein